MIHTAAFPTWMIIMIVFMVMGQIRFFSRRGREISMGKRERLGLAGVGDVQRLEEALGVRDQVIEDLQRRLSELESRLDFTERLISEKSHAGEQ